MNWFFSKSTTLTWKGLSDPSELEDYKRHFQNLRFLLYLTEIYKVLQVRQKSWCLPGRIQYRNDFFHCPTCNSSMPCFGRSAWLEVPSQGIFHVKVKSLLLIPYVFNRQKEGTSVSILSVGNRSTVIKSLGWVWQTQEFNVPRNQNVLPHFSSAPSHNKICFFHSTAIFLFHLIGWGRNKF